MKKFNKLGLFILAFLITGCAFMSNYQKDIYNNNKIIIKEDDNYTYLKHNSQVTEKGDKDTFTSFTGMDTKYKITVQEEEKVVFNFKSVVDKGDFKIVLITPEKKVIKLLEGTKEESKTILLNKGTSRIKFIGKETTGKINFSIDAGKNVEIE